VDAKELFDAQAVHFPSPKVFRGPNDEVSLLLDTFGENMEKFCGVVQIATANLKKIGDNGASLDCPGYIHYPTARYPEPSMMDRGREEFPKAHNFLFVLDRPETMKGVPKVMPQEDFDAMAKLWIAYARKVGEPILMKQFLRGPSSKHVMDIQVVMNAKTEGDGIYGLHSFGLGAFIPFDPNTDPVRDTADGPPAEILKLLELLSRARGGVSPVLEPKDAIDAEFERLMKLPELPGVKKGGKGSTH